MHQVTLDPFPLLVANAPLVSMSWVALKLGWPAGLPAWPSTKGDSEYAYQEEEDNFNTRWNALSYAKRIQLEDEWRIDFALRMSRLIEKAKAKPEATQ